MSLVNRFLDATIVFSFDRTGYRRHARRFDPRALEVRLDGQVCLVTGANSGIGRETALALAARGASVRLVCRDEKRGRAALDELVQRTGNREARLELCDVSDLASVRRLAERLADEKVDVLVHNAGVLPSERTLTPQGLELTFATHVVGPFLLGKLLEPRLRRAAGARVIFVSSGGMYPVRLSLEDLDWTARRWDGVAAYAQTKRMQVVLAELLAERSQGIAVHSMHPGWADTPAVRTSLPRFWRVTHRILRTPEQGADTVVWLAVSEEARRSSGGFWFDRERRSTHLVPGTRESRGDRERFLSLVLAASETPPGGAR